MLFSIGMRTDGAICFSQRRSPLLDAYTSAERIVAEYVSPPGRQGRGSRPELRAGFGNAIISSSPVDCRTEQKLSS